MNVDDILNYFDLQSGRRPNVPQQQTEQQAQPFPVLPQYLALVLGIAIQPSFAKFQQSHIWRFEGWQGWICFSLVVGLLIFPGVYKKSFDRSSSNLWVQLCTIFASGIGWQSLLDTGARATHLIR